MPPTVPTGSATTVLTVPTGSATTVFTVSTTASTTGTEVGAPGSGIGIVGVGTPVWARRLRRRCGRRGRQPVSSSSGVAVGVGRRARTPSAASRRAHRRRRRCGLRPLGGLGLRGGRSGRGSVGSRHNCVGRRSRRDERPASRRRLRCDEDRREPERVTQALASDPISLRADLAGAVSRRRRHDRSARALRSRLDSNATGSAHGTSAAAIRSTTFGSGTDRPVAASKGTGRQIPAATTSVSSRPAERKRGAKTLFEGVRRTRDAY